MNFNNERGLAPSTPADKAALQHGSESMYAAAPVGADDFAPDPGLDPLAGATAGRKLSGGTIIVIAVILSAVAGLFSMRKLAEVTAAATIDTDIEKTIDAFFKKLEPTGGTAVAQFSPATDTVLDVLTDTYSERQVPLRDVQRDPFIINEPEPVTAAQGDPVVTQPADTGRKQREWERNRDDRRQTMEADGAKIVVKSIMGGSRPMALIDRQIVVVGDRVTAKNTATEFVVESISTGSIDLVSEDPEFQLTVRVTAFLQRD